MITRRGYRTYNLRFTVGDGPVNLIHLYISHISESARSGENLRPFIFHQHAHVELQYVLEGRGSLVTRDARLPIEAGDLVLIPPQVGHRLECEGDRFCRMILTLHLFHPVGGLVGDAVHRFFSAYSGTAAQVVPAGMSTTLIQVLDGLGRCVKDGNPGPLEQERLRALCALLLLELYPQLPEQAHVAPIAKTRTQQAMFIDDYLQENFAQKNLSDMLARELHVSPRHLNRLVRAACGMNLREKLNTIRLNFAMDQLTNTRTPVAHIAHLMGYGSTTAFGSFIKGQTGMTPSQLRDGGKQ